jgi:hypothetical protein
MPLKTTDIDIFYQNVSELTTKCSGFLDNVHVSNHKIYWSQGRDFNPASFEHEEEVLNIEYNLTGKLHRLHILPIFIYFFV